MKAKAHYKGLVALCLLAIPILFHEGYHGFSDPRSFLHPLHPASDWLAPLFASDDLGPLSAHVFIAACDIAFIWLAVILVYSSRYRVDKKTIPETRQGI